LARRQALNATKGQKEGQFGWVAATAIVATLATDGWDRIGFNE
jgi:hypothetical protein